VTALLVSAAKLFSVPFSERQISKVKRSSAQTEFGM